MELTLPSFPYQICVLLLFFALCLKFLHRNKTRNSLSKCKLPPGPWTLPFIGSLHHLTSARLPHRALHDLARSHGPVMLIRTGQTDLVAITSREAAHEVMKIQDSKFSNRPMLSSVKMCNSGCNLVFSNGPYWRQLRRICINELLSTRRVKSLTSIRREEVNSLLKWLSTNSGKSSDKLIEKVSEVTNNTVACAAFGGRCKRQDLFLTTLKKLTEQTSWISPSDFFPSLSWLDVKMRTIFFKNYRILDTIMEETIQDHLQKQKHYLNDGDKEIEYDLVDVFIREMENDNGVVPITFDSVKAVILDMFAGGTDTATTTIEWAMAELIKHPKIMAKVQAELRQTAVGDAEFAKDDVMKLNYLKLVIKETLRLHPPLPLLLPRQCKETCQLLDYTIPSGARVLVNAWALGRDPEYWTDAEEFIPDRFEGSSYDHIRNTFEFIPFGAGRRSCPGVEFGMAVVEIVLSRLLLHFDWRLPDGVMPSDVDMAEELGAVCRRKKPLTLIPVLCAPLRPDV